MFKAILIGLFFFPSKSYTGGITVVHVINHTYTYDAFMYICLYVYKYVIERLFTIDGVRNKFNEMPDACYSILLYNNTLLAFEAPQ